MKTITFENGETVELTEHGWKKIRGRVGALIRMQNEMWDMEAEIEKIIGRQLDGMGEALSTICAAMDTLPEGERGDEVVGLYFEDLIAEPK